MPAPSRALLRRVRHRWAWWWTLLAFVVGHALAVVVGRATRLEDTQLALVWPAAAVATLWLLHARSTQRSRLHAVALVLATVAGNLLTGASPALAAVFGAITLVQALATVVLLPPAFRLCTVASLGRLVLACSAGSLASAITGSVVLHALVGEDIAMTLVLVSVRNTTSAIVLVAVALQLCDLTPTARPTAAGRLEVALVLSLLGTGYALVYATPAVPAGLLLLPLSMWVALRSSTTVASVHALCTATTVVVLSSVGRGPFADEPPVVGVLLAQVFVVVVALVVLSLALTSDERADLVRRLRREQQQSAAQAMVLEVVLDTVDVAIVAADASGQPLLVNRTARALHGLADDDRGLPAGVPVDSVLREGGPSDALLVVDVRGRSPRTVRSEGRAMRDADGALLGAVVVQTDVTALCASEQQFRAAFEDGPTPAARLDGSGRLEQTNTALRRLLAEPTTRLLGRRLADLAVTEDRELLAAAERAGTGPVEVRLLRADGRPLWCEVSLTWLRPPGAVPYVLVQVLDVHARKTHELALEDTAHRDALTGLDNRRAVDQRLGRLLQGGEGTHVVVAYLDLDGFKAVNDVHGHDAGDAVLREVGRRLLRMVRAEDLAARLGGDEFVLACVVPGGQVAEQFATTLATRIERVLSEPVQHEGLRLDLGVSVGTAVAPSNADPAEVLRRADVVMYARKRARHAATAAAHRPAALPVDEDLRLAALHAAQVLDTPPDRALDDLCQVAALIAGVPTAMVSLVDEQRQWFKAKCGLGVDETGRDVSFCSHVVALSDELHVEDARRDPRFADNPLVVGEMGLRSYAGFPLRTADGHVLGSLCVIGYVPGLLTEAQRRVLRMLAAQAGAALLRPTADEREQLGDRSVPAQREPSERSSGTPRAATASSTPAITWTRAVEPARALSS